MKGFARAIASILPVVFTFSALAAPPTFSTAGNEHQVSFEGVFRTDLKDLTEVTQMSAEARTSFQEYSILPTTDYIFGPLTERQLGASKKLQTITVAWDKASVRDGQVELPYLYEGTWILSEELSKLPTFQIPVPFNTDVVLSSKWKNCTDSEPEHQTADFYWYFWDPARSGCDHKEGREYFTATVVVGAMTPETTESYPEYERLFRQVNGAKELSITLAFGYVEDPKKFNPEKDNDPGMFEYRKFLKSFRGNWAKKLGLKETAILQSEYRSIPDGKVVLGHRFVGKVRGAQVKVNVVTSAGVDQMELFAKSFAHDHDGLFAWFGHSRVGSGFDADRFEEMLGQTPDYLKLTDDYQIIYWAGCNSYSYYSTPFFRLKGGTKNLDILGNGLPSLFSLNATNAELVIEDFLNWEKKTSYQAIVKQIEQNASTENSKVLVIILGDEDNAK